jgi:hypothetical protein
LADVAGLSKATIARLWQTFGLQSHRLGTFKLSADPQFVEKGRDSVGLYLCPPDRAIVLSMDEKSQVQALDRTRPLLPMRRGIPARQTHDYIRPRYDVPLRGLGSRNGESDRTVSSAPSSAGVSEVSRAR